MSLFILAQTASSTTEENTEHKTDAGYPKVGALTVENVTGDNTVSLLEGNSPKSELLSMHKASTTYPALSTSTTYDTRFFHNIPDRLFPRKNSRKAAPCQYRTPSRFDGKNVCPPFWPKDLESWLLLNGNKELLRQFAWLEIGLTD